MCFIITELLVVDRQSALACLPSKQDCSKHNVLAFWSCTLCIAGHLDHCYITCSKCIKQIISKNFIMGKKKKKKAHNNNKQYKSIK